MKDYISPSAQEWSLSSKHPLINIATQIRMQNQTYGVLKLSLYNGQSILVFEQRAQTQLQPARESVDRPGSCDIICKGLRSPLSLPMGESLFQYCLFWIDHSSAALASWYLGMCSRHTCISRITERGKQYVRVVKYQIEQSAKFITMHVVRYSQWIQKNEGLGEKLPECLQNQSLIIYCKNINYRATRAYQGV